MNSSTLITMAIRSGPVFEIVPPRVLTIRNTNFKD